MAMRVRVLLSSGVVMLTAMWLVSCSGHYTCGITFGSSTCNSSGSGGISQGGGGNTVQNPAAFDYFLNSGLTEAAYVDTSGNFNLIPNFVKPNLTLSGSGGMLIVQKQWLYQAIGLKIYGYSINGATGALTAMTSSPFASPDAEVDSVIADPAGKFLFLSGANDEQVTVFAINQTDGSLTTVGSTNIGFFAGQLTTDGLGKYLYVTLSNLGTEVAAFAIGATGTLTPVLGSPFSISIAQLEGEPTGNFLLGVTGNGANNGVGSDNHIYVFAIDQTTGAIAQVTSSPFATKFIPASLTVHPSGKFVYTFDGTVSGTSPGTEGYIFDTTTGALTPVAGSPFTAVAATYGKFDQSGLFLFTQPSGAVAVAGVNTTTGALSSIGSPITGLGPSGGEFAVTDPH
jgi:lactonase family protein with 7-bladed beta-propeller